MAYNDKHNLIFPLKSDYYDIDVFNQNFSKLADDLDRDIKAVETEAKNKDGGNADTVDGKHATDFASFKHFDSIGTMRESQYEGGFSFSGDYGVISGYSFYGDKKQDIRPDNVVYFDCYMRLYCDNDTWYLATDYYNDDDGKWTHNDVKKLEFQGHKHKKEDITDFPTTMKADGGNADTVGGKSADDFATVSHTHTTSSITNFPTALPANGGNADTVGGKSISDLLAKTNRYLAVESTDFNTITDMGVYTIGTEDGTEMSTGKNQPVGAYQWGTLAVFASGSYGLTQVYYTHIGDTYIRGLYGDVNWNSWKKTGGEADNIIKKNFSTQKECWYRIAETKNSQAGGIFVISVDDKNSHNAMVVISASQQYASNAYSTQKLQELSYSTLNGCLSAFRIVLDNNNCYLEFKTNNTITNGKTGSIEVQFLGRGWNVLDTVITDNTATNVFKEITLS